MNEPLPTVPMEDFVKALSAQLDRAQAALLLKARNTELTFAVKELTLDLRAQLEIRDAAIRVRPAAPGESDASTVRIAFTTVSRKTLEESALGMQAAEPGLSDEVEGLSEEEQRRFEWIGVTNLGQLQRARAAGGEREIRRLANIPAERLRRALELTRARRVVEVRPVRDAVVPDGPAMRPADGAGTPGRLSPRERLRLRLVGRNLEAGPVRVRVDGRPAAVVERHAGGLLVEPDRLAPAGTVTLAFADGEVLDAPYTLDDGGGWAAGPDRGSPSP